MKALAGLSLVLVVVLVSLSAYLRLAHSGIGCERWPECYGHIGLAEAPVASADTGPAAATGEAYERLLRRSGQSAAWATPLHRLVASVLGLAVVFLTVLAFRQRRHRVNTVLLLGLTVWLALLGLRSGSLHDPAVVMGNLAGGFAMLGLLGWLRFRLGSGRGRSGRGAVPVTLLVIALSLLSAQIVLGGLTSANFAATACTTLPDCNGGWWPGPALTDAFDLGRPHELTAGGEVVGGPERVAIHRAHRLGAVVTAVALLAVGLLAMRDRSERRTGAVILALLAAEFTIGVAAVRFDLPIGLAVAHNWVGALLLLGLLWLLAQRGLPQSERHGRL